MALYRYCLIKTKNPLVQDFEFLPLRLRLVTLRIKVRTEMGVFFSRGPAFRIYGGLLFS
jgi:hypothetical protein